MAQLTEPDGSSNAAGALAAGDIVPAYVSHAAPEQMALCTTILGILFEFALHKFDDTLDRLAVGKTKFLSVIEHFVTNGKRLEMCLPAFPFKSANKEYKVLGALPDKAEEIALERLDNICVRIGKIYPPGAQLLIISDGLVYNDLLSVSDRDTWAYGEALRAMATRKNFNHIGFSRLRDLVEFPSPEVLNEISYVASATNFRRYLLNQYGKDDIDIDHEIESDKDTMMTYLGYRRFLVSDLQYIFPVSASRTKNGYKRDVKYLAQQMLIRGYAFAGAVKANYPHHLRLSIHQSTGEHKISLSLLNTKSDFTTPWHCSVALMADGTWLSAPKGEFERDTNFEVVTENGRPNYFQEKACDPPETSLGEVQVLVEQPASTSSAYAPARSSFSPIDEKSFADPTQAASSITSPSTIKEEKREPVNPFLTSDHPELDPTSDRFSARVWLETFMSIARDSDSNPKPVAGIAYKSLSVHAFREPEGYQRTFGNQILALVSWSRRLMTRRKKVRVQILKDFEGLVKSGEMLVILGRPGSGCSTFLNTIAGESDGLYTSEDSYLNYQGIPKEMMHKDFRGECIYQAEQDVHFPQLTVGQTLDFAARARASRHLPPGVDMKTYTKHLRDVYMSIFGLTHTANTMVGNDFVRGVSGGERKRVSLAEVAIAGSPLQAWDNSTRGLDSATALGFAKTLRLSAEVTGSTACVSLYQASQSIYEIFDKVAVLYEGRQIYFGDVHAAKDFFVEMGFECPPRQTTADFLTSITNPSKRRIRPNFRGNPPKTPDEFAAAWRNSDDRAHLMNQIEAFDKRYPLGGPSVDDFKRSRRVVQAKSLRVKSPYTLSLSTQVRLCVERGYQRTRGDMSVLISGILFNSVMALVIGSVFYNLPNNTNTLYLRGSLLFFSILLVAFSSSLEILALYAQRPIVEKHSRYAFYHPFAEAIASMLCDLPNKLFTTIGFDLALYFMTNLRRTPGHFFVFLLFTFACTLTMSMYFRFIAAVSKTLAQAMAPASVFSLALVIYTGFAIPTKYIRPWFRWMNYLNPVAYAFESLMINEFHDRRIPCSRYVPEGNGYGGSSPNERICATTGAAAGADFIDGDDYLAVNFGYHSSHLWRNFGIMIALMIFGCFIYLLASEYILEQKSKGEVLVFRRYYEPDLQRQTDEETSSDYTVKAATVTHESGPSVPANIQQHTAVIHWEDIKFDVNIKKSTKRILNNVSGWVRPGTLTALMGVSGAGKTTLLDVLASRNTIGIVSGDIYIDGRPRNSGFQRKTGYAQQQDVHLPTSTVREALTFSAVLRQPHSVPNAEKIAYVDEVIKILEMEAYAGAIVGVPGEGLNVEQRKRLTIGVELAARPALLLFLDEPTSGLDSQTAWSICTLLRKLADNGQAVLCTLHQPSANLFQMFDRLLYLAMEGKPVYFGELGSSSRIVINYFESRGARSIERDENPAEWILEVTGTAPSQKGGSESWPELWNASEELREVKTELARMKGELSHKPEVIADADALRPYAEDTCTQLWWVVRRNFQQYWRTPSYVIPKIALCLFSALFIGFSFWKTPNTIQGLQNQLFAVFLLITIFGNFCSQMMPHIVRRRELFEARECQAKAYSWQVFVLSDILVEIPWNSLAAVLVFVSWYYPINLQQNAEYAGQTAERGGLMFLFILAFLNFAGTFTSMALSLVGSAEAAGNIITLLFSLSLIFCGVLATPTALPGFWIFMYRVSPLTYLVSGMLSTGLANARITCVAEELLRFAPPAGSNCTTYLIDYQNLHGGYLTPESAGSTSECVFCTGNETNVYLNSVSVEYSDRWRNFGIFWVYVMFNAAAAIGFYWLARVPKAKKKA